MTIAGCFTREQTYPEPESRRGLELCGRQDGKIAVVSRVGLARREQYDNRLDGCRLLMTPRKDEG